MPEISLVINTTSMLYIQDTLDCKFKINILQITPLLFTVFNPCGELQTSGAGFNLSTATGQRIFESAGWRLQYLMEKFLSLTTSSSYCGVKID